jgi:hypothetical protein
LAATRSSAAGSPGACRLQAAFQSYTPVSYVLNVLGEIGAADLIFAPRARYAGRSAIAWVVEHMSEGAKEEGTRLYMINHALVSYALRLRGAKARETETFRNFQFRLASIQRQTTV